MVFITNKAFIRRPIEPVFALATTAKYWTRWHPATTAVRGSIDHPVELNEQIIEDARVAGRDGTATWTCVEREPPYRLVLTASGAAGTYYRIEYTFAEHEDGTEFTRDLTYQIPSLNAARGETLTVSRAMREQSAKAVENLRALLEAEIPAEAPT